jgi:hypothetical protein
MLLKSLKTNGSKNEQNIVCGWKSTRNHRTTEWKTWTHVINQSEQQVICVFRGIVQTAPI